MLLVKTFLDRSKIHGLGVFAGEYLAKGTKIWRFVDGYDRCWTPKQFAKLPKAARDYLKTVRDGFDKQSMKTTNEKFDAEDGFSFNSGMLATKKNIWLRVNVYSTVGKVVVLDLTRQLMLDALRAN